MRLRGRLRRAEAALVKLALFTSKELHAGDVDKSKRRATKPAHRILKCKNKLSIAMAATITQAQKQALVDNLQLESVFSRCPFEDVKTNAPQ
jgi:hypothetical protein